MKSRKRSLSIRLGICLFLMGGLAAVSISGCRQTKEKQTYETNKLQESKKDLEEEAKKAAHTPLGRYPETVTYTLGKIAGANHANLPVGATYEDNAYTRYLRQVLNIQNQDVFELEDGATYEQAVELSLIHI